MNFYIFPNHAGMLGRYKPLKGSIGHRLGVGLNKPPLIDSLLSMSPTDFADTYHKAFAPQATFFDRAQFFVVLDEATTTHKITEDFASNLKLACALKNRELKNCIQLYANLILFNRNLVRANFTADDDNDDRRFPFLRVSEGNYDGNYIPQEDPLKKEQSPNIGDKVESLLGKYADGTHLYFLYSDIKAICEQHKEEKLKETRLDELKKVKQTAMQKEQAAFDLLCFPFDHLVSWWYHKDCAQQLEQLERRK